MGGATSWSGIWGRAGRQKTARGEELGLWEGSVGGGQNPHPATSISELSVFGFRAAPRPPFYGLEPARFGPEVVFTKPRFTKGGFGNPRLGPPVSGPGTHREQPTERNPYERRCR